MSETCEESFGDTERCWMCEEPFLSVSQNFSPYV